ncbi:hypothetical protein Q5705_15435 [Kosakonia sp. H02]|nr:hypothetical protein Q5705_15435 [Kosakonia sp. H02]
MQDRITVTLPVDGLLFWKLSGREALSEAFTLSLTVLGTDARTDRSRLLGQPVTKSLMRKHGAFLLLSFCTVSFTSPAKLNCDAHH